MMRSRTIIAIPPGATIKEQLRDREMRQKEFALRMGLSEKHVSHLINGDVKLTSDVAMRLEMVLGIPARFWSNLESIYREKLEKAEAENSMNADIEIAKKLPYNEMSKNGWVEPTLKPVDRVVNLRKFFELVSLELLGNPAISEIACRKLGKGEKSDYALLAWAQKAKLEARNRSAGPINIDKLIALLPEIREMTKQPPEVFSPMLCEKMACCGITLVFLPHIGGSFLHGATFCDGSKIIIGMTLRGKDADRFWFSLLHEIGHVVLGHIHQTDGTSGDSEREADIFAGNCLIPEAAYERFKKNGRFDAFSVISFAEQIGVDKGIVVGRLQNDGLLEFSQLNNLKTRYELSA